MMMITVILPTYNEADEVPSVSVENTFEILDKSVSYHLQHQTLLPKVGVPGDHDLTLGVGAEGVHEASLKK